MSLAKIGEDVYRALQVPAGEIPHVSTWSELRQYPQQHVVADINVVGRGRRPLRLTLHRVKCSKCGWEGTITSSDKPWCRFCRGLLQVQDTVHIELKVGKIMVPNSKSNSSGMEELDAVFIDAARDISPGKRRVIAYLSWAPGKSKLEQPVLIVVREVHEKREVKVDLTSIIEHIQDWRERLALLTDIVSQVFNIRGLRPHILLLLTLIVGAHGVQPFTEDDAARQRWWIHGAIIGDPGTGKSTLSEIVRKITPHEKCILLSGPAVTLPGLTVGQALGYPCEGALLILDGGPSDFGVLVIDESHRMRLEVLHEIKDGLERGEFYRALAGEPNIGGPCRTSLLLIANYLSGVFRGVDSLPEWLRDPAFTDRLDFVLFTFTPTDEMTYDIVRGMLRRARSQVTPADIASYIERCRWYEPLVVSPDDVAEKIYENAKALRAAYQDVDIYKSPVRLALSLARISIALAKLALADLTPDIVDYAAELLETQISAVTEAVSRYVQSHTIPASEYLIRKVLIDILRLRGGKATREELISQTCEMLERQFYKCDEYRVDKVIQMLKNEGIIYEPELGKLALVGLQ